MSNDLYCPVANKKKYRTYCEALLKLDLRQGGITGLASLSGSVYPCDGCGGFHISHKKFILQKVKGRGQAAPWPGEEGGMKSISRVVVTFTREGIEYAVTYAHGDELVADDPGSKRRATGAARMASAALQAALEGLDKGEPTWGGCGTNEQVSTDTIVIDRRNPN